MADKPIPLYAHEVRGVQGGRQTQLRRLLKPQPHRTATEAVETVNIHTGSTGRWRWVRDDHASDDGYEYLEEFKLPWQPGDRLWVRETWRLVGSGLSAQGHLYPAEHVVYEADGAETYITTPTRQHTVSLSRRPSIHMSRWASRITLVVTDVRVQRLQEISEEDAKAEGIGFDFSRDPLASARNACWWASAIDSRRGFNSARAAFHELWDSLNARRGFSWEGNPWVVAVTFKPYLCNIDKFSGLSPETAAKEADDAE